MATCQGCGAPAGGIVCGYCGRSLIQTPGLEQELAVLHDYHLLLSQRRGEELSALLQHGFMPQTEPALIEAGLRCLAALDPWGDQGSANPPEDAANRIDAIAARLRVVGRSREAERAAEEMLRAVASYRKRRRNVWLMVVVPLPVIVVVALVASAFRSCGAA